MAELTMFKASIVVALLAVCLVGIQSRQPQLPVPPPPRHHGLQKIMKMYHTHEMDGIQRELDEWSPSDKRNIWELSGMLEGDIMVDENEKFERNAVRGVTTKWPDGEVPYHISDEFEEDDVTVIMGAMDEIKDASCIKFRPYQEGDNDWITIRGDSPGCWSYVGRRGGGQVVNLGHRCVQHGVAAHELLHALGFHHQQSSPDRDSYVTIHWKNIRKGTERNFRKYPSSRVTDFGVGYDYDSVMHYSTHAFSRNGKPTITPKESGASIGQRGGLSDKDMKKLNALYGCSSTGGGGGGETEFPLKFSPFTPSKYIPSKYSPSKYSSYTPSNEVSISKFNLYSPIFGKTEYSNDHSWPSGPSGPTENSAISSSPLFSSPFSNDFSFRNNHYRSSPVQSNLYPSRNRYSHNRDNIGKHEFYYNVY